MNRQSNTTVSTPCHLLAWSRKRKRKWLFWSFFKASCEWEWEWRVQEGYGEAALRRYLDPEPSPTCREHTEWFWRAKHLGVRPAAPARGADVRTAKREFWKLAGAQSDRRGNGRCRNVNKDCIKAAVGGRASSRHTVLSLSLWRGGGLFQLCCSVSCFCVFIPCPVSERVQPADMSARVLLICHQIKRLARRRDAPSTFADSRRGNEQ